MGMAGDAGGGAAGVAGVRAGSAAHSTAAVETAKGFDGGVPPGERRGGLAVVVSGKCSPLPFEEEQSPPPQSIAETQLQWR